MTKFRVIETEYADQLLETRGTEVAQPVLVINRVSRTIYVDTRFSGDARTFAEERGETVLFDIPLLGGDAADKLMTEVVALGDLLDDDDLIDGAIASIISDYEANLEYTFAEDWFDPALVGEIGVTADTTDDEILDFVKITELAFGGRILECEEYLKKIRASMKAEE